MIEVQLRVAYVWDCPDCGAENFARQMLTGDGTLIVPDKITCKHCKEKFQADVPIRWTRCDEDDE